VLLLVVGLLLATGSAAVAATPAPPGPETPDTKGGAERVAVSDGPPADRAFAPPPDAAPKDAPTVEQRVAPEAGYRKYTARYGPMTMKQFETWDGWVECPDGMRASGGGEFNSSNGGVHLKASRPLVDGTGWFVTVENTYTQDAEFTVYTVCFSALANYTLSTDRKQAEPEWIGTAKAVCPPGQLIGGGGVMDNLNGHLAATSPSGQLEQGWQFTTLSYNLERTPLTAHAVCADGIGDREVVTGTWTRLPAGGFGTATVTCPAGKTVVSGGTQSTGPNVLITDSYPDGDGTWRVYAQSSGETDEILPTAICGT
jgi:hypothetical protein